MKKILALCLSVVMLLSLSTTAFAAEMWDKSAGSGETEIHAHIYSSYTITIPATIDLRNGEQGEVTLTNPNIESGYSVKVYCNNIVEEGGIRLYHTTNQNTTLLCSLINLEKNQNIMDSTAPLVTFTQDEVTSEATIKYFGIEVMDTMCTPGDYIGTMQYSFECSPIEE